MLQLLNQTRVSFMAMTNKSYTTPYFYYCISNETNSSCNDSDYN